MGATAEMEKAPPKSGGATVKVGDGADATAPQFATIATWCALTGMSRRVVYEQLGLGNLKAIKVGARTLVDVPHGLAYMRSLPPAKIRASQHLRKANY